METTAANLQPGDVVVLRDTDIVVESVTPNPDPHLDGRTVTVEATDGTVRTWKSGTWLTVAQRGGVDVTHVRGSGR